jgi:hypothetical protein
MLIEEGSSRNRGEISVIIIDNNPWSCFNFKERNEFYETSSSFYLV